MRIWSLLLFPLFKLLLDSEKIKQIFPTLKMIFDPGKISNKPLLIKDLSDQCICLFSLTALVILGALMLSKILRG